MHTCSCFWFARSLPVPVNQRAYPLLSAMVLSSLTLPIAALSAQAQSSELRIKDLQQHTQAKDLYFQEQPLIFAQDAQPQTITTPSTPPTPSSKKDGFYVSVSGDARFIRKARIEPVDASLTFSPGFGINAAVGYRFKNNLRLEGEFSYGSNNVDEARLPEIPPTTLGTVTTNVPLTIANPITTPIPIVIPGIGTIPAGSTIPAGVVLNPGPPITTANAVTVAGFTIPAGTNLSAIPGLTTTGGGTTTTTITSPAIPAATVKVDGKISTLSGLLNLYYDIPTGSRFEPYIGGGIGVSRASADNLSATYPGTTVGFGISGSTTAFVYQLRAGVAYNIDNNFSATLGYRYFNIAKQSFDADPFGELDVDGLGVHNIELGLRYRF
jgi:opacity protein-like surface antigen